MKKLFIIKTTYVAKETHPSYKVGHTEIYYSGRERTYVELCEWVKEDAYLRKEYAQRKIAKDKEFDERFNQNSAWEITREIIEL